MKRFWPLLVLALVAAMSFPIISPKESHALTGADWQAGLIIDDGIFTDANSMNVSDIQNFLNAQVPNCDTNGTQKATEYGRSDLTHAQYAASRGWPAPPYVCLRNYYEVPKTSPATGMPDNSYNHGGGWFSGGTSAAQLIYNAAQQYQINPKVLLVMIHKESAGPLTTDSWPLQSQYQYPLGAHCPDSTGCDPNYMGFSIQISESASLLRWYIDSMTQSWWQYKKPYATNNVLWNPSASCGASNVYIESKATAALYTYTPYQPNAAALANLYGTGDSCSSYGNRNFWRVFNDWFGGTEPWAVAINARYNQLSSAQQTTLGSAQGAITIAGSKKTAWQSYANGAIIWGDQTGAWESMGPIRDRWAQLGYQAGKMGFPVGQITTSSDGKTAWQAYKNGYIVWGDQTGAWESKGAIRQYWAKLGYQGGKLGFPVGPEVYDSATNAWSQQYQNGYIVGSPSTSYWESMGPIRDRWAQLGYQAGKMGFPVGQITTSSDGKTAWQAYKNGYIVWGDQTGAWESKGAIRQYWAKLGYQGGIAGYPTGPEVYTTASHTWSQTYQHGTIYHADSGSSWFTASP